MTCAPFEEQDVARAARVTCQENSPLMPHVVHENETFPIDNLPLPVHHPPPTWGTMMLPVTVRRQPFSALVDHVDGRRGRSFSYWRQPGALVALGLLLAAGLVSPVEAQVSSKSLFLPYFNTTPGQWATGVAVVNVGPAGATIAGEVVDSAGATLVSGTPSLPALGLIGFDVATIVGPDRSGWLHGEGDQPLAAVVGYFNLQSGALAGLAGVNAGSRTLFIPYFNTTRGQWGTAVAVTNVGTANTTARVEAFGGTGASLGTATFSVLARGQALFDVGATFGEDRSGWLSISADQPLVAAAGYFNLQSGGLAGLTGVSAGSPTVFFPHFDTTAGQWGTAVVVTNVGTASTTARVEAFGGNGASLGTATFSIPANGQAPFDVGATFGADQSGWLSISADQPLVAAAGYFPVQSADLAGVTGVSAGSRTLFIPYFDTTPGQWAIKVAVANVGTAGTTARVEAFNSIGAPLGTATLTIAANGREAFDTAATLGTNLSGWLSITSDQPLVASVIYTNLVSRAIAGVEAVAFPPPDEIPPTLRIDPADGSSVNTRTPLIHIAYSDAGSGIDLSTFQAEINGIESAHLFTLTPSEATLQVATALPGGPNRIAAKIRDGAGNLAQAASNFTVSTFRALPEAHPTQGVAPLTVTFISKAEYTDGVIKRYRWDLDGDGVFEISDPGARNHTFTYTQKGTYRAVLEVMNDKGQVATATVTITVTGVPPTASADAIPSNGAVPLTVSFLGFGSDPDGLIVNYEWDFDGDGAFDFVSTTTGSTTHTYAAQGTFNALFRVTDNDGLTATARVTIRVGPPGSPSVEASASPTSGNAPLAVAFSGTATPAAGRTIALWEWDFTGDGVFDFSSATSASTSFTYNSPGTFTAALRARDDAGSASIDTVNITVSMTTTLSILNDTVRIRPPGTIENLVRVVPVTTNVSSSFAGYGPERAIDGNLNTSWFTRCGDAANLGTTPFYEVIFPFDVTVTQINMRGNRQFAAGYDFFRGRFDVFSSADAVLFSQTVDLPAPDRDIDLDIPDQTGVRRVRFTGLADQSCEPGFAELEVLGPAPAPAAGIATTIGGTVPVSLFIKDQSGNVVRRLVTNQTRTAGSYVDMWDVKDEGGVLVPHGTYFAILEYVEAGQTRTVDLTTTTGGVLYNPAFTIEGQDCFSCSYVIKPLEDDPLDIEFTIPVTEGASEVTATIIFGPYLEAEAVATLLDRKAFGVGSHSLKWDGTDTVGRIAVPPVGKTLQVGIIAFTLPDNAIFVEAAPELSNVSADPNFFDPSTGDFITADNPTTRIAYTVSKQATVTLQVVNTATNRLTRTITQANVPAGSNTIAWDGRNDNGIFADSGDYRLALKAHDASGSQSLVRYVLVRVFY